MKEPIYRVVLRIIEVKEDAFREWLDEHSENDRELAIEHFIRFSAIRPEVRRIYLTAKVFYNLGDADRCFNASLREFNFNKESLQYFKDLKIEKFYDPNNNPRVIKEVNELTGG